MTKRAGAWFLMVSLVLGCGGDDDSDGDVAGEADAGAGADAREQADAADVSCEVSGSITGMVDAEMIDPVASAYSRPHPTITYAHILRVDEDPNSSCTRPDGETDEALEFIFCDQPAVAEYEVVTADDFPTEACPGELVVGALVESGNGAERGVGESGTLTIESLDDCLTASFAVGFDQGNLDGDVVATVCP